MVGHQAAAIIVAAGRSERFGGGNKLLLPLAGKTVLTHALEAALRATHVSSVVIVAGSEVRTVIDRQVSDGQLSKPLRVVDGGSRRQDSVAAGLDAVQGSASSVVILDGARPLTTAALIDRCIVAAGSESAIAAIPVTDTLKRVDENGMIVTTVSRDGLWAAQTPQVFPLDCLRRAFHEGMVDGAIYTDEASLFESLGWPVKVVPSDESNLKITWPGDLEQAELFLAGAAPAGSKRG